MNKKESKWIPYLDFLRLLAIALIVFYHVTVLIFNVHEDYNSISFYILIGIRAICCCCLPLLFMISGYIMLSSNKEFSIKTLYTKYILRFLIGILIFGTLFDYINLNFHYLVITDPASSAALFNLNNLGKAIIDVLTGNIEFGATHIWFLYTITFLYMLLPLLKLYTKKASIKVQSYVLLVLVIFTFIIPAVSDFCGVQIKLDFPISSRYLIYFLFGYYLSCLDLKKIKVYIPLLIFIVSFIYLCKVDQAFDYTSENLKLFGGLVMTICVFILSSKINCQFKFSKFMNKNLYGIYLIHPLFLSTRFFNINLRDIDPLLGSICFFIAIFILSFVIVWLLRKIPIIRKYLL